MELSRFLFGCLVQDCGEGAVLAKEYPPKIRDGSIPKIRPNQVIPYVKHGHTGAGGARRVEPAMLAEQQEKVDLSGARDGGRGKREDGGAGSTAVGEGGACDAG